ncbi:MAG: hypothetical protein SGJ10_06955 [Bacteroidota bacterium]|nr:hypothetical protein [Bacteroidota bacterium]
MKKLSLFAALLFAYGVTTAQDLCGNVTAVVDASSTGFEAMKGKFSGAQYDGQWTATQNIAGAKSCVIEENSGWYIATMVSGVSEDAAKAKFSDLKTKLQGCTAGMQSWGYDNIGEHLKTVFFSESKQPQNANGGETNIDEKKRDSFSDWDALPSGKTIELEIRKVNGGGSGFEVRIKIYKA